MTTICAATAWAADAPPPTDRHELGILPVLGGDTDVGFRFGGFVQVAHFREGAWPYAWRGQATVIGSVRSGATGTEFPHREVTLKFDRPWSPRLRLFANLNYFRTTNRGFFGLGNASPAEPRWEGLAAGSPEFVAARRYYQFDGSDPGAELGVLVTLVPGWQVVANSSLHFTRVVPYPDSLLARQLASGVELRSIGDAIEPRIFAGLVRDTRDHETVTTRGQYHEVTVRGSPGGRNLAPYWGANLTLRNYFNIAGDRLSVATRVLGDLLSAQAPLAELSNYGGIASGSGPGGARGVRGIPEGRLAGRTKLMANVELRTFFLPFALWGQRLVVGAAAAFDAGRVWTGTLRSVPELDGNAWTLHWGAGGGPRLRWGDSLVIRADVMYAPLGANLGSAPAIYVDVDQVM